MIHPASETERLTRPKLKHALIQSRIATLFNAIFKGQGWALVEFTFRPLPEDELRVTDVGWISRGRLKQMDRQDHVVGAPEIVVEILSPFNTLLEMPLKKRLCFGAGCQEFWIVDPKELQIEVSPIDGASRVFRKGDRIPVANSRCSVDEILDDADYI